ncbi:integral membrane protein [Paraphaeosphaeria sporulosa]
MEIIYLATNTLTKTSICTFYNRMSPSLISRPIYITIWASIIFVLVFPRWHVQACWYRFTTSCSQTHYYKCQDELTTFLVITPTSVTQDFIACLLPLFAVWKFKLQLVQKLGLSIIFGEGTCAIGSFRIYLAWKVYHYTEIHSQNYDITWEALGSWGSATVEALSHYPVLLRLRSAYISPALGGHIVKNVPLGSMGGARDQGSSSSLQQVDSIAVNFSQLYGAFYSGIRTKYALR